MPENVAADLAAPLTLKLSEYAPLDEEEIGALRELVNGAIDVPAGTELLQEGDCGKSAYIVLEGWSYCYKDLEDGRRQVVSFHFPGDFLGLRSILLRTSDHSSATLTNCRAVSVPKAEWERLFADHPRLGTAVLWTVARDEAILVEHMVNLGRRSADERTAHLLSECAHQLRRRELIVGKSFVVPMSQSLLADALGLSVVHLNRTLRKLREARLVEVRNSKLRVLDIDGLETLAKFDGDYLD